MHSQYKQSKKKRNPKPALWLLAVALILLVIFIALELSGRTSLLLNRNSLPPVTAGQETKGEPVDSGTKNAAPQTQAATDKEDGKAPEGTYTPSSTVSLREPSGTFVSNHRPNLSGSPAPSTIHSNCTTTPGAICQIIFTKGNVTKTLKPQKTDKGGSAYWTWALQEIGITEGTWSIQAIATYGSQTKTATDSLALEVQE